jgi:hypothetical protein
LLIKIKSTKLDHDHHQNISSSQLQSDAETKIEKEIPVDGSVHGVTEHGQARGHGGEEALALVLLRTTHLAL